MGKKQQPKTQPKPTPSERRNGNGTVTVVRDPKTGRLPQPYLDALSA